MASYGHVLFFYFDNEYVFRRSNEISKKVYAHVSNLFMCEKSNLYGTK